MIRNRTPDQNSGCSTMTFGNALRQFAFTGIASNTNAAIMVAHIKAGFVRKHHLLPISPPVFMFTSPLQPQASMVLRQGILYKGVLARSPRCSRRRRIDEADSDTVVAVDQSAANCLDEAIRSITAMRARCLSSRVDVTFRRPFPDFRVVRFSLVHCFQTLITVVLLRCTRATIAR